MTDLSQAERTARTPGRQLHDRLEGSEVSSGSKYYDWMNPAVKARWERLAAEIDKGMESLGLRLNDAERDRVTGRERERALEGALRRLLVSALPTRTDAERDAAVENALDLLTASPGEPEGQPGYDALLDLERRVLDVTEPGAGVLNDLGMEDASYKAIMEKVEESARAVLQPDHGPGGPSETTVFTELVGVDEIKRGDTIWAPDDGDWLLVDTYARIDREAEFRRKDGSIATFDRAKQILRRAVRQVGESNG